MPPSDPVITALGAFGPWQARTLFLVALVKIPAAWQMMSILFLASSPETFGGTYFCARSDPDKWSPEEWIKRWHPKSTKFLNGFDPCYVYDGFGNITVHESVDDGSGLVACQKFEFLVDRPTMITKWSLVCNRNKLINVVQFFYLFGIFCGGVVNFILLKKISPRAVILVGAALQVAAGIALALQPIYEIHCFLKYLIGLSACIMFSSGYHIIVDVTGGWQKLVLGVCYEHFWSIGALSLGWLSELTRSWVNLQLVITVPTSLFLFLFWALPDSPRWMIAHGKKEQAEKLLRSAAESNGRKLPEDFSLPEPQKPPNDSEVKPLPKMKILCCQLIWISTIVTYYGGLLNFRSVGGTNLPGRTTIAGAAEIIGTSIGLLLVLKPKYKIGFQSLLLFIGGTCCVCSWAISPNYMGSRGSWTMVGLAVIGRISIACSLAVMTNGGTADFIPIQRRPKTIMLLLTGGRLFLMGAPFLNSLAFYADSITLSVYGGLILVAAISSLYLFVTSECNEDSFKVVNILSAVSIKNDWNVEKPHVHRSPEEKIVCTHFNPSFISDDGLERVI